MNILIIGSEGFIGGNLVKYFSVSSNTLFGCDVFETSSVLENNYIKVSRLAPQWPEVFVNAQIDICINAGGSGNVPYSMQQPLSDFESNVLDTVRILDSIRKHRPSCKYLHLSSAAVYGNPIKLPIEEKDICRPISAYGWHKLMAEQTCREFYELYKLPVALLRPFSVYGERLRKQLLWDICEGLRKEQHLKLFGNGQETRDFIHVMDLAKLIDIVINKSSFAGECYNCAMGRETTIEAVANLVVNCWPERRTVSFNGQIREGDPRNWRADIRKISKLGFEPSINLKEGVGGYVNWYMKYQRTE